MSRRDSKPVFIPSNCKGEGDGHKIRVVDNKWLLCKFAYEQFQTDLSLFISKNKFEIWLYH